MDNFQTFCFYRKIFASLEYIIRYIPHPERMSLAIQPCLVADDALINHITLQLPGLGLWQKVIVYLMSRSHETQISSCWLLNCWWTKSCSFFGGWQTRMNGICISQLDFVHQQHRFRFNLCSQIGIVETAKMLEQQPVTLTCSSINIFLWFRILDDLSFSRKASDEFGQSSHWSSHVRLQKIGSDKKKKRTGWTPGSANIAG